MNVLIAGASGFIGKRLAAVLQVNHTVTVLGRDIKNLKRHFKKPVMIVSWDSLPELDAGDYDAVINLSGYNIAAARWSASVKKQLIDSRVQTTRM